MTSKKRAMNGLALAGLLLLIMQVRDCCAKQQAAEESPSVCKQWDSPWTSSNHSDLKLDAFNLELCGDANFQDWQRRQSAFGFKSNKSHVEGPERENLDGRDVRPRIVDGSAAAEGEFPFFAHLNMTDEKDNATSLCGGTLIHKDLVVTAAHCLTDVIKIELFLGSNEFNHSGAISRTASKWCWPNKFGGSLTTVSGYDLAVVRLAELVEYERFKIAPACLWPRDRHSNESTCVLAGLGDNGPGSSPKVLQTINFTREDCDWIGDGTRSCYRSEKFGTSCPGDSGSPYVCYDRSLEDQGITKAFVVGAHNAGGNRGCYPHQNTQSIMADFHLLEEDFAQMLHQVQREEDASEDGKIICRRANSSQAAI